MFKIEMDKNSGVLYPLETGNRAWNDFKINNRATILFEKEDKNDKETISLNQINDLYGEEKEEKEEKKEIKSKHIKRCEKINNNVIYDPNTKKIEVKKNKTNDNNNNKNKHEEKEIKIKPIFERKDKIKVNDIELNKKINIKEDIIIDDKNKESNNNIPSKGGLYIKKKMDK
jgi:hypothetical protein